MIKQPTNTALEEEDHSKKRATKLPTTLYQINSATTPYRTRDFLVECQKFGRYHKDIQSAIVKIDITKLKSPSIPEEATSKKWIEDALKASATFCSDEIFYDTKGQAFLFYVRWSLSRTDVLKLTTATKKFCSLQNPHAKTNTDAGKHYKRPSHNSTTPGVYNFTSLELGHGSKGFS